MVCVRQVNESRSQTEALPAISCVCKREELSVNVFCFFLHSKKYSSKVKNMTHGRAHFASASRLSTETTWPSGWSEVRCFHRQLPRANFTTQLNNSLRPEAVQYFESERYAQCE
jgi:hypothetical protein